MKHVLQNSKVALFAGLFIIVIGASAWQIQTDGKQANESRMQACRDTTRPGTTYPDQIDLRVNIDSIMKAAQTAISAIDYNKLQQEINAAVAKINFDEINKNIDAAMKNIDWEKMKIDVNKEMDEAKAEMAKVDKEQIKQSLEKAKAELQSEQFKQQIDMSNLQKELEKNMEKARKEMEKAKVEITNYRNFVSALQSDGLIKPGEPYKIELKDNVLYINGVKQSKSTTERYRKYYQGKTNFTLYDNKGKGDKNKDDEGTDL
jgi:hypothetical protein